MTMSESSKRPIRLTRVRFKSEIDLYPVQTHGNAVGKDSDVMAADAVGSGTNVRPAYVIELHEESPLPYVTLHSVARPEGKIRVYVTNVAHVERRWNDLPYKKLIDENDEVYEAVHGKKRPVETEKVPPSPATARA